MFKLVVFVLASALIIEATHHYVFRELAREGGKVFALGDAGFLTMFSFAETGLTTSGAPSLDGSLAEAVKNANWEVFQSLLRQNAQNPWATSLVANVENLKKPDENTHVFGHAVSTFKAWSNDNGKVSESSDGLEVLNKDGVVTSRHFTP